jgi:leucyl/phenylalanyl-tRNA--protein transferase
MLALGKSRTEAIPAPRPENYALDEPAAVGEARETAYERVRRWALGVAYALQPQRILSVPHLLFWTTLDALKGGTEIPDQNRTRSRPDTFGGVVRELTPRTYLAAVKRGFFPWAHCGPLKWWTRKKRMVLFLPELHTSRRLKRLARSGKYRVTFDTAFDRVVAACSAPRAYNWHALTWLTPSFRHLFSELHREGHAHSFEVWNESGDLVGGGFGIAVGRIFVGESMFSLEPDTSKLGAIALYAHLEKWGFELVDARDHTPVLERAGFREIPRAEYEALLAAHAASGGRSGSWSADAADVAASAARQGPALEIAN